MIETPKRRTFKVSFESSLFPNSPTNTISQGLNPNWDKINQTVDVYYAGQKVIVTTTAPTQDLEKVRITLEDHGVLFDQLEQKSN